METAARLNLGNHRASVRPLLGFSEPCVFPLSFTHTHTHTHTHTRARARARTHAAVSRTGVISGVRASPRLLCVRAPVLRAKASCRGVAAVPDVPDFIYFTTDTRAIKEQEEKSSKSDKREARARGNASSPRELFGALELFKVEVHLEVRDFAPR